MIFRTKNSTYELDGRRRHPERYPFGVKHHRAKLNPEIVREVRKLRSQGLGSWRIAKRFNVTQGAIDGVLRGKTWRHV